LQKDTHRHLKLESEESRQQTCNANRRRSVQLVPLNRRRHPSLVVHLIFVTLHHYLRRRPKAPEPAKATLSSATSLQHRLIVARNASRRVTPRAFNLTPTSLLHIRPATSTFYSRSTQIRKSVYTSTTLLMQDICKIIYSTLTIAQFVNLYFHPY